MNRTCMGYKVFKVPIALMCHNCTLGDAPLVKLVCLVEYDFVHLTYIHV